MGLYHVHRNLEPFSYDGYRYYRPYAVAEQAFHQLPLSERVINVLEKGGVKGAVDLAERLVEGRVDIKGFGPQGIKEVENWLRTKPRA